MFEFDGSIKPGSEKKLFFLNKVPWVPRKGRDLAAHNILVCIANVSGTHPSPHVHENMFILFKVFRLYFSVKFLHKLDGVHVIRTNDLSLLHLSPASVTAHPSSGGSATELSVFDINSHDVQDVDVQVSFICRGQI